MLASVATRLAVSISPVLASASETVTVSPASTVPFAGVKFSASSRALMALISAAGARITVLTLAALFAALVSVEPVATVAVFVTVPSDTAWVVTVMVAPAPEARLPRLQVNVPAAKVPKLADTNDTPAGNGSLTTALSAVSGP